MALIVVVVTLVVMATRPRWFPVARGRRGERIVAAELSRLPHRSYMVLNNLLLPFGNGTCQIDHVVVSVYGIFVIETKTFSGWIYGLTERHDWYHGCGRRKSAFYNPVFQNMTHIKCLQGKLGRGVPCRSIVAVLGASSLKVSGKLASTVMAGCRLRGYIRRFRNRVLSPGECRQMCALLMEANLTDRSSRRAHIRRVRQLHC